MFALSGSIKSKVNSIINAGFYIILHCSGSIEDIKQVLLNTPLVNKNLYSKWKLSLYKIDNVCIGSNKKIYKKEINKIIYNLLKIEPDYY